MADTLTVRVTGESISWVSPVLGPDGRQVVRAIPGSGTSRRHPKWKHHVAFRGEVVDLPLSDARRVAEHVEVVEGHYPIGALGPDDADPVPPADDLARALAGYEYEPQIVGAPFHLTDGFDRLVDENGDPIHLPEGDLANPTVLIETLDPSATTEAVAAAVADALNGEAMGDGSGEALPEVTDPPAEGIAEPVTEPIHHGGGWYTVPGQDERIRMTKQQAAAWTPEGAE